MYQNHIQYFVLRQTIRNFIPSTIKTQYFVSFKFVAEQYIVISIIVNYVPFRILLQEKYYSLKGS